MGQQKKGQAKDDLISSLLDDAGDIAGNESLIDMTYDEDGATVGVPREKPPIPAVGLLGDDERVEEKTKVRSSDLWASLEGSLPPVENVTADTKSIITAPKESSFEKNLSYEKDAATAGAIRDDVNFPFSPKSSDESAYRGPSAGEGGYQSLDDLGGDLILDDSEVPLDDIPFGEESSVLPQFESAQGLENEATRPLMAMRPLEDKTAMVSDTSSGMTSSVNEHDATVAADGFAQRRSGKSPIPEKVVIGSAQGRNGNVFTSVDASLAQAENLRLAQQRILEIEKENDRLRKENEEVSSAADTIRGRLDEMTSKINRLEREKQDIQESAQNEVMILKGNLQFRESEVAKARLRIDELESRLRNDFKKIRVKERELENRLELARAEKSALVRAKDENILELKRKIDSLQSEIDNYREKCLELNKTIESHQEQFKRTVRALRLALGNLEAKDSNVVPLKKAD